MQPSLESYYAVRRNGLPAILKWDLKTPPSTKESRRVLDALTILTSSCVTTPGASYAASFYASLGQGSPQTTILFSGDSEGVPTTVKHFLEQAFLPQLRTIASSDLMTHATANDIVFHEILSFGFDHWWRLVSTISLEVWEEALALVSPLYENARPALADLTKLLRELYLACELVKNRSILREDSLRIRVLLAAINNALVDSVSWALVDRDLTKDDTYLTGWGIFNMLGDKDIIPVDSRGILDDQGNLAPNFSCTRHIANVISPMKFAFRLSWLVQKRRDLFSNIATVFCEPTRLEAPLDTARVCHSYLQESGFAAVTSEQHVTAHLHPPMNVLQHLLPLTNTRHVVVFPALASTVPLCRGCYDFLRALNNMQEDFLLREPFTFPASYGKVVFPWLAPDLGNMGQRHAAIRSECRRLIDASLRGACLYA